ncbi:MULTISPECIES: hypothetical protein [unclassified Clostridioides]|uniref:hypothetical protein n=1 Tax=unclassified Clostridioides TaxID=2635829 RepID=UPI001D0CC008|nr:hypothetical protein [Clostridioides sp. ES-S-0001-02]MCC0673328.1 hypothetical protein [Clostridioides sp. ES-S-0145-01]MCC0679095.1 hypothetical protein [Clostridioides sp. ES-S-0005-03]MCC0694394.1 hypothetical protein [Clostridioides sp. ES-S-0048-02]MCC0761896.1 hypothetical protein [Clostridioides sp. ES-S-0006-03]UDN48900.1 hypothetical protein JJJ25_07535 [Clostridioides sp. ES-S-0173-01]UDN57104.1 hypothetical protein JJC01_13085 [Clostridioides sp. ES-S-0010-02]UDN63303.1 hypoth
MNSWNIIFLSYGVTFTIVVTVGYLIKGKTNYCKKKYLDKLELKYGNIDREKATKLEIFYHYLIGLEYIIMGLLTRRLDTAIISVILVSIITIISYYLIRKRYIVL